MASLADLQKRMTAVFEEVNAQKFNIHDVIPPNIHSYLQGPEELSTAQNYTTEVEEREAEACRVKQALELELKKANDTIQSIQNNEKQLKIDLIQEQLAVDFYKNLSNDAADRATLYQQKWEQTLKTQSTNEDTNTKIKRLESDCTESKLTMRKLVDENRGLQDIVEGLQDKHNQTLEKKELRLMEMERALDNSKIQYSELEQESDQLETMYSGLVEKLENDAVNDAAALNRATMRAEVAEEKVSRALKLHRITLAGLKPLNRSFEHCCDALQIFEEVFHKLLSTTNEYVTDLPDSLQDNLNRVFAEYELFTKVQQEIFAQHSDNHEILNQTAYLGDCAERMCESLWVIKGDVGDFLKTLERRPEFWHLLRLKLIGLSSSPHLRR